MLAWKHLQREWPLYLQGVAMPGGLDDVQQAAWERDVAFLAQLQDSSAAVTTCQRGVKLPIARHVS